MQGVIDSTLQDIPEEQMAEMKAEMNVTDPQHVYCPKCKEVSRY
jgi:hypothetical protein